MPVEVRRTVTTSAKERFVVPSYLSQLLIAFTPRASGGDFRKSVGRRPTTGANAIEASLRLRWEIACTLMVAQELDRLVSSMQ